MNGRLIPVSKSAGPAYAVRHAAKVSLGHPKRLALVAGAGAGAVGAEQATDHPKARLAEGAVGGGVAGWGAHQLGVYPIKWQARNATQWYRNASDFNDRPELKKTIKAEQKMRGRWKRGHEAAGTWNKPAGVMYRDFPAEHRRAKTMRTLGYTHGGRTGEALSLATIGVGAALGARAARRRKVSKSVFGKLVPVIRVLKDETRALNADVREFLASSPVVVTPQMRDSVRRTAEQTPRSFVAAGAARKGSGLVLMAHADRKHRDR